MYKIEVLSCIILKESPTHGETDLVAEVGVDACTAESFYRFIEEFEDLAFVNLNQLQRGDKEINGPQTKVNILRKCQHNVYRRNFSEKSEKEVSGNKNVHGEEGKNTNCQSCYKFKLSACKEAAAGREGPLKTTNCKCLRFSLN